MGRHAESLSVPRYLPPVLLGVGRLRVLERAVEALATPAAPEWQLWRILGSYPQKMFASLWVNHTL